MKKYISKVEANIKLQDVEKRKLYELKLVHTKNHWNVTKEFKDKPELAQKRKEVGVTYFKLLVEAFGKDCAMEISKVYK
ncbi:hypothetical protein [Wenyingzhuangia sp. 2_MG-2023]|uniref:hypothetical protein n=1 Tax=Wenyingzhuangia sp. 2_MG-2023 TaxID=3062639 RepID=UPI0026E131BB|nr:hypothetical protein [Wenyingzhuangia sp. 2_MG-2023]